jgi:D-hydroxyproline dehydrogenase subunit beta
MDWQGGIMSRQQVGIVGAGIVGLAQAWSAAERGHAVTVFERTPVARGASIRNFGMVWPIGQPAGELHQLALLSRERWLRLAAAAGIWVNPCGSIHLAHHADEWTVLQEFHAESARLGQDCDLLSPEQVRDRSPGVNPHGLQGGLFSPTELCVNPKQVIRSIPAWLADTCGVRFRFNAHVTEVSPMDGEAGGVELRTAWGGSQKFDRVIVCGGTEFRSLFPEVFEQSELIVCKLQMLATLPQPRGWKLGPHLAGGLTLRHYRNFEVCPGLPAVRKRIAEETPELDRYGIHVMAAQNDRGEVILGDSHEYGEEVEPFDRTIIDALILRELHKISQFPEWEIAARWHGRYAKHPDLAVFESEPAPGIWICNGVGGAGMTMSFGIAERTWQRWSDA